jgi:membrane protein YdbS with pleckstrin-like domain
MQINSKTREQFPLSPKKITKKTLTSIVPWFILVICIYAIVAPLSLGMEIEYKNALLFIIPFCVFIGLLILVTFIEYYYQRWYFNVYFYDLTPDYIVIKKGPITPKEITIPYERVQDVYVDQDIFDRIFGLYDVHLSSATISSGMQAHIDGVEKPAADGLRMLLLQTVSSKLNKNKEQAVPQVSPVADSPK